MKENPTIISGKHAFNATSMNYNLRGSWLSNGLLRRTNNRHLLWKCNHYNQAFSTKNAVLTCFSQAWPFDISPVAMKLDWNRLNCQQMPFWIKISVKTGTLYERHCVSYHQQHNGFFKSFFRLIIKTSNLRRTVSCWGYPSVTEGLHSKRASNTTTKPLI